MPGLVLIEPTELYNILNQKTNYPCLSDANFVLLLDARKKVEYDESHIITAKRATQTSDGVFSVAYGSELECKIHVIIYDSRCHTLREESRAVQCGTAMAANGSKNPVKILRGGYEDFSAMYPFLRTQKVIYMPQELDAIRTYPCEVLPSMLYIGSKEQAQNPQVHKDLKIQAHLNLSNSADAFFSDEDTDSYLHVPVFDGVEDKFGSFIPKILSFIDHNRKRVRTILIWSDWGMSKSAAACVAYLMSYYKWPLKDAWRHVKACKFNVRPDRALVQQLSAFEAEIHGQKITNVEDPKY